MDFDGHFNRSGGRVSMVAVDIGFDGINYINYIVVPHAMILGGKGLLSK